MGKTFDLTGHVVERLTVLRRAGKTGYWVCRCSCGQETSTSTHKLRTAKAKSCGCLLREKAAQRMRERRTSHGMSNTPEFLTYMGAKKRCSCKKTNQYANYGGRGIQFKFLSFEEFFHCLGVKPTPKHTIERIDSDGHYEPGNVRWATTHEQASNRRSNRYISHEGSVLTLAQWSRKTGIPRTALSYRLGSGWPVSKALNTPTR